MDFKRMLSPQHYELIEPLIKWKILSLDYLAVSTWKDYIDSNFYKKISKMEKNGLLASFIDHYSKEKFVYLTKKGMESLGVKSLTPINSENLYHDSFVSENAFHFFDYPFTKNIMVEHEIMEKYPMIGHRPDSLVEGDMDKPFRMAMEMELTAKSKERILEIYSFYSDSQFFNNVVYIFGQQRTYEMYMKVLEENKLDLQKDKFLFMIVPDLHLRQFDTFHSDVTHMGKKTSLNALFGKLKWGGEKTGNDRVMSSN